VPFAGGAETEQGLRAQVLAEQHWIDIVEETALTPQTLAEAINRAAARPPLQPGAIRLDGAETSARLIAGWIQAVAP
jgi:predicted glycosyltransferase